MAGRKPPPVIVGTLEGDPEAERELAEWCAIAMVLHDLKRARIGHFGHPIEHMLDMQTDQTALTATFGCHVVQTEADDLLRLSRAVTDDAIEAKKKEIFALFDTPDPKADPITEKLTEKDLQMAALAAVTLERFVETHRLDGLAYYYEGEAGSPLRELVTNLIAGNSLLTAAGFPMCGESDLKTVATVATLTLYAFLGVECATIPAENIKDPERTVPRATMIGTLLTTLIYIAATVVLFGLVPIESLKNSPAPKKT